MLNNHGDILYNFYVLKGNLTLNFYEYSDYIIQITSSIIVSVIKGNTVNNDL